MSRTVTTDLVVDNINPNSGANITMLASLIIPDIREVDVAGARVDYLGKRGLSPTIISNDDFEIAATKKLIVDEIETHVANDLTVVADNDIIMSADNVAIGGNTSVTGNFTVTGSNVSTFGGNIVGNTNIFLPNITTSSSEYVAEVVYDTLSNRIMARPVDLNYVKKLEDRFEYVFTSWTSVPSIGTIGDPVIDAITGFLSYPTAADTVGTIVSSHPWRIRMNNTNDVYCYSMTRNGMHIFIPSAASARNFFIHRPFGAYKGVDASGGFYFFFRVAITNLYTNSSVYFGLVSPSGANPFLFDGSNTLTSTIEAVGFLVDYSINSNYKLRLLVRKASVTTTYETALTVSANTMYDLKIYWNKDKSTLTYAYGTSSGILLTQTAITTFSSNPNTDVLYDPCVSVNRPTSDFGIVISRIQMTHEEIL